MPGIGQAIFFDLIVMCRPMFANMPAISLGFSRELKIFKILYEK